MVCLLINALQADKSWGNIHAYKLGSHQVRVNKNDTNLYTFTEFTYPEVTILQWTFHFDCESHILIGFLIEIL